MESVIDNLGEALEKLEKANSILFNRGEVEARTYVNDAKLKLGIAKRILDES